MPPSVLPPSSRNTFLIINTPGTTVLATEVAEKPWTTGLQTWEAAAQDSKDPSPSTARWPIWGSTGFPSNLRGSQGTKFGVTKEKTRPGRTEDAGKTSLKGPLGVTRPLKSRQGSTVGGWMQS